MMIVVLSFLKFFIFSLFFLIWFLKLFKNFTKSILKMSQIISVIFPNFSIRNIVLSYFVVALELLSNHFNQISVDLSNWWGKLKFDSLNNKNYKIIIIIYHYHPIDYWVKSMFNFMVEVFYSLDYSMHS